MCVCVHACRWAGARARARAHGVCTRNAACVCVRSAAVVVVVALLFRVILVFEIVFLAVSVLLLF